MDDLKNKVYAKYDYVARYSGIPSYYNVRDDRTVMGLSKNMYKDVAWVAHKVKTTDTLDSLALSYYNNPSYWWIIAYFNDIQDAFVKLSDYFEILKIPSVTTLSFGDLR